MELKGGTAGQEGPEHQVKSVGSHPEIVGAPKGLRWGTAG